MIPAIEERNCRYLFIDIFRIGEIANKEGDIIVAGITDFLYHNKILVRFLRESKKSARPQPVMMSTIREPSIFLRESNET